MMDHLPQRAVVVAERISVIVTGQSRPAPSAYPILIQRPVGQKRRPAPRTKIVGRHRLRFMQARFAIRNPARVAKNFATQ
jgi:hypothetical protein